MENSFNQEKNLPHIPDPSLDQLVKDFQIVKNFTMPQYIALRKETMDLANVVYNKGVADNLMGRVGKIVTEYGESRDFHEAVKVPFEQFDSRLLESAIYTHYIRTLKEKLITEC